MLLLPIFRYSFFCMYAFGANKHDLFNLAGLLETARAEIPQRVRAEGLNFQETTWFIIWKRLRKSCIVMILAYNNRLLEKGHNSLCNVDVT